MPWSKGIWSLEQGDLEACGISAATKLGGTERVDLASATVSVDLH